MTIILIILVAWFLIVGIATNFGEKGNYRPPKEKWSDRYEGPRPFYMPKKKKNKHTFCLFLSDNDALILGKTKISASFLL